MAIAEMIYRTSVLLLLVIAGRPAVETDSLTRVAVVSCVAFVAGMAAIWSGVDRSRPESLR